MKYLWNLKSSVYHFLRSLPGIRWIMIHEKENLRKLLTPDINFDQLIVDIGSGSGSCLDIFPAHLTVVIVDQSADMLKQARKRRERILPVVASAGALPFKPMIFRFCSCIGVVEYFSEPDIQLNEMHRILIHSGRLLITFPKNTRINSLRLFLGHHIYLQNASWRSLLHKTYFKPINTAHSWLQTQVIAKKSN